MIKIAPVYLEFTKSSSKPFLIATAQHREMMDMMLEVFGLSVRYDLNIMTHNQTLNSITSRVVSELHPIMEKEKPDVLFVQGDTTTAMAAAICAFHLGVKIAHIEAGLRSGFLRDPFPEEMNRRVIDTLSDYLFAPTQRAKENLISEGIDSKKIFVVGNTVVDALNFIRSKADLTRIKRRITNLNDYVLLTLHRRENIGVRMENILQAVKSFAEEKLVPVVFPVHKNPRVRKIARDILNGCQYVRLIEPVNYVEFLSLLNDCLFVVTDSGGIQEEAPSFGKFVVVARETTERPELIENGCGVLSGTERESVYNAMVAAMNKTTESFENPFGDGRSSQRILSIVEEKI